MKWIVGVSLVLFSGCVMKGASTPSSSGPASPSGGEPSGSGPVASEPAAGRDANGELTVPNLIGKTQEEAAALVKAAGFHNDMEQTAPIDCGSAAPKDQGKINCQSPPAGSKQKAYAMVQVTVYAKQTHPGRLLAEDLDPLKGKTYAEGKAYLASLGYHAQIILDISQTVIPNCAPEHICKYDPQAVDLHGEGEHITLTVNQKVIAPLPEE